MKIDFKAIEKKLLAAFKNMAAPTIEVEVKKYINLHSDELVELVANKFKALIPGNIDDNLINGQLEEAKRDAKNYLLNLSDKISDKV